ncbi:TadE/TadG family type IV pilus assembly protein [Pseudoalteromonas denitrificans]|uniref:TadE-like protein n=1 Tax=Pseudoalteromonas denitrificans DSM 6059 TaxID=1123010 RepID=A0A1I1LZC2_9GAMM|nr:TadE family protein [Pseudoalteromonas denitrificans]SFC74820.1 TadE-like protein [Pseudoalteromonas denitrificans DSM 6059]
MASIKKQRGSMVIETAFVLPILIFIVFSGLELARGLMIRASLNQVVAEAAREIKLTATASGSYQAQIIEIIGRNKASLLNKNKIKVIQVSYFKNPEQLALNNASSDRAGLTAPIAKYQVEYSLSTFSPWLKSLNFNTEILVKYEA